MAQQGKNETLEQRRKAMAEFIKLKQAQQNGETLEASVVDAAPKTFKEKLVNFWYYYKGAVLGVLLAVVVIVGICAECASRPKPDLQIVVYDNNIIMNTYLKELGKYYETICPDYNGDGKISVAIIDCTFQTGVSTADYQLSKMQKLQSLIATDKKAILFICGDDTYDFLNDLGGGGLMSERIPLSEDVYKAVALDEGVELTAGLGISARKIEGTFFENDEEATEHYRRALDFLEKIK